MLYIQVKILNPLIYILTFEDIKSRLLPKCVNEGLIILPSKKIKIRSLCSLVDAKEKPRE